MRIGIPKEVKTHEYRVGAQPAGVRELVKAGHSVRVERRAGEGSGFSDDDYKVAGATLVESAEEAWDCEMVIKVKEPIAQEYGFFRAGQVLYTYLHLAAAKELTHKLVEAGVRGVAYETVTDGAGGLPLLRPMSEIAGRMSVQVGASCLEKWRGGRGVLLGGVPGTRRGRVTILGGGIVGTEAARIALGMGASVTVLDVDGSRMAELENIFGTAIETLYSNKDTVSDSVRRADLVIGAVLIPGGAAPKLVDEALLGKMMPGSVVVDVAVDQGGCIETCRPTTHDKPTYIVQGIVHYCVANMPGAVPYTSTYALTNATLRYALDIANAGIVSAAKSNAHIANGINTFDGACTNRGVASALGLDYRPLSSVMN